MEAKFGKRGYVGNLWFQEHLLAKIGDVHQGHRHRHDHVTMLVRGRAKIEVAGNAKEFTAPWPIVIKKDVWHRITALEDGTIYYCIFALRDKDGMATDVFTGDLSPYIWAPHTDEEARRELARLHTENCEGCTGCA